MGGLYALGAFGAAYAGAHFFAPKQDILIEPLGGAPAVRSASPGSSEWVVHVTGAVKNPGVVRLPAGSRVIDAIEKCGGALPDADLDAPNLAAILIDGEKIHLARKSEPTPTIQEAAALPDPKEAGAGPAKTAEPARASAPKESAPGKVSLNTGSMSQLDTLPGVGPATARKIIEYRQAHGGFASIDELINVSGIGEKKLEKIRPFVRL